MSWSVGVNLPGYLPDNLPRNFGSYSEAFLELLWELNTSRGLQPELDSGTVDKLDEAIAWCCGEVKRRPGGDLEIEFFGLSHWLRKNPFLPLKDGYLTRSYND